MIRPARQACVGSSRPLPGVVAAAASCRRPIPRRRFRCSAEAPRAASDDADEAASKPTATSPQSTSSSSSSPPPDPEKRWRLARLWGGHSSSYRVPGVSDWLARAPQVRVRQKRDRQLEQLADLAVVNERLAGGSGPQARARVDFLRGRRRLWARVYDVVTRSDVGATLDAIERATGEVRGALELSRGGGGEEREGGSVSSQQQQLMTERERLGVAALRERLVSLQEQLAAATERLSTSRARLSHNEERLRSLKAAQEALEAALARKEEEEEAAGAEGAAGAAPTSSSHLPSSNLGIDRGSWVPLAFVAELDRKPGTMLPVEVGGVPWVLFRTVPRAAAAAASSSDGGDSGDDELEAVLGDDEGESRRTSSPIACLRDECAHRACPLSLGKVDAAGRAVCPYHGWAYDGLSGSCVEMPSTLHRRGVGVASMRVGVRDGVVWGWKREEDSSTASSSSSPLPPSRPSRLLLPPLPATAATPEGFVVVAEAAVPNSPSPPGKVRDALARGGAALAARAPGSAAARGLLPSSSSSSSSPPSAPVETVVIEEGGGGASAVVTLASGFGGSERNIGNSSTSLLPPPPPPSPRPPPLLRLLHLVAPGRVGGSRLLLRVCVAEGAAAATAVFGSGKRRLWASLAEEAAEEDAKLGLGGGGEGEDNDDGGGGGVAAASSTASSVFRL